MVSLSLGRRLCLLVAGVIGGGLWLTAAAQAVPDKAKASSAPRAYLQRLLGMPGWLDVGAEYRLRYETEDHRYRTGEQGGDQQLAQRARLRIGLRPKRAPIRFLAEFEDSRAMLTDVGSTVNAGHVRKLSVLQLQVQYVSNSFFGHAVHSEVDFGRLTMDLGKRRLVARNSFRNTTNRFDGLNWRLEASGRWALRSFLVQPVVYSPPDLNRGVRRGYFWGAYLEDQRTPWMKRDYYYLQLYEDPATVSVARRLATLGARAYLNPAKAGWIFELETAWQFGHDGSQDHFAFLQVAEAGRRFSGSWAPSLLFQYLYASGDRDPSDHSNGRFDGLFGSRRFELGPIGILGLFSRGNLSTPGYRFTARPLKSLEATVGHRFYWLAQGRDQWVGTGRRDIGGASGTHLGQLLESFLRWKVHPNLAFEFGYARFQPGEFARRQVPVAGKLGCNYLYVSDEITF